MINTVLVHTGDHGKLGHGDTAKVYRPRVIEALQGLTIRKLTTGTQVSFALAAHGQVSNDISCSILNSRRLIDSTTRGFRMS